MGKDLFDAVSMAGSPAAWAIVILLGLVILSPRLLPVLARLLVEHMSREARRRLGIPIETPRPRARNATQDVEVLPPERPTVTLRAGAETSLAPKAKSSPQLPVWLFVTVVTTAVAVLSWLLLKTR